MREALWGKRGSWWVEVSGLEGCYDLVVCCAARILGWAKTACDWLLGAGHDLSVSKEYLHQQAKSLEVEQ